MKKIMFLMSMLVLGVSQVSMLYAQVPVRNEDRFWAKRIVMRMDLEEKINRPLVHHASAYYGQDKYTEKNGMVAALINGLKRQEYLAYHPYDWNETLDYESLLKRMEAFEQALTGESESLDEAIIASNDLDEFDLVEDEWGGFEDENLPEINDSKANQNTAALPDLSNYEQSFHIVEDWIFNKARASMQQNIDFFEVIWTDPAGLLPEKVLARFRWEDVKDILARTEWKNRFNDAELRSIKEVMELRIFHAYPISVGGEPVRSLSEADRRKLEIIEFESHLWSH